MFPFYGFYVEQKYCNKKYPGRTSNGSGLIVTFKMKLLYAAAFVHGISKFFTTKHSRYAVKVVLNTRLYSDYVTT